MDAAGGEQVLINSELWRSSDNVRCYANRRLLPVEVVILTRYRDALARRVLEAGCGAGRILGYLVALDGEVHGFDISPAMVAYCRSRYPRARVVLGDLAAPEAAVEGPFDAVLAMDNVLDVFDHDQRGRVLAALRGLLGPGGVLIFSSHNLDYIDRLTAAGPRRSRARHLVSRAISRPPDEIVAWTLRMPRRMRNRRRLAPLQQRAADHAIVNDQAHDFGLLHYYIRRDDQARQLAERGLELVECLDEDGTPVAPGAPAPGPCLHYVARSTA